MPRRVPIVVPVLWLLAVAVGAFFLRDLWALGGLLVSQIVLGALVRVRLKQLLRPFRRLAAFAVLIIASYALMGGHAGSTDQLLRLPPWPWPINVTGLLFGCAMVLRVLTVVVTSTWVQRSGEPGDFVKALRQLGLPKSFATLVDRVLLLLQSEPEGRRRGAGGGRGGGKHRRHKQTSPGLTVRRLIHGDASALLDKIESAIARAAAGRPAPTDVDEAPVVSRDMAILAGLLLLMLGLKAIKILPGVPFAPGHKGVIFIPLYLLAVRLTRGRWRATLLGATFGVVAFLLGDGRYGVFEIFKHIAPGLIADALAPLLRRRQLSVVSYALIGMLIAVGRWASIALIVLLVGSPPPVVALLAPVGLVHLGFGALSGAVTRFLIGASDRISAAVDRAVEEEGALAASRPPVVSPTAGSAGGGGDGSGRGRGGGKGKRRAGRGSKHAGGRPDVP